MLMMLEEKNRRGRNLLVTQFVCLSDANSIVCKSIISNTIFEEERNLNEGAEERGLLIENEE